MHGGEVENTDGDFVLYLYTRVAMKLALLVVTEDEAKKGLGSSVGLHNYSVKYKHGK